jgi:hypothetical protein
MISGKLSVYIGFHCAVRSTLLDCNMQHPPSALTLQFLAWVDHRPRTYAEAMEAWRSTCPRLSIWEDAILDGLIRFENEAGRPRDDAIVVLTPQARALLEARTDEPAQAGSEAAARR